MPASGPIKPTLAPQTPAPEDDCSSATSNDGAGLVFTAHAEPSGSDFAAPAAMPLLLAAQRAGLLLPSSCRNGTCRACICQLTSGRVAYRIDWPGLSAEEKREGWIDSRPNGSPDGVLATLRSGCQSEWPLAQ